MSSDSAKPGGPFAVGSAVRVRPGVTDPNFPDLQLGGWCGAVREVDADESPPLYLVAWDRRTLDGIDPEHRRRCDRADLEVETMWLASDALEPFPDDGPEARLRAAFGLAADAPLPEVNADSLGRCHAHLSERLSFPFAAACREGPGPLRAKLDPILVLRLLPADGVGEKGELFAEVVRGSETLALPLRAVECAAGDPHCVPLADYAFWLEQGRGQVAAPRPPEVGPLPDSLSRLLLLCGLVAAAGGSALGAVLESVEGARLGATVGAAVLSAVGLLVGVRYFRALSRSPSGALIGGLFGALAGAAAGALAGALAVAYVGSILGSIVGVLLGRTLAGLGRKPMGEVGWGLLGACAGGLLLALYHDQARAGAGSVYGALVGLTAGVLGTLALLVALASLTGFRK